MKDLPKREVKERSAWGAGKLILSGEHSVVYGQPALAIGLPRGLKASLIPTVSTHEALTLDPHNFQGKLGDPEYKALNQALQCAISWFEQMNRKLSQPHLLRISGALPFKVGMGSSAALSVALLRVLSQACGGRPLSDEELFDGAMELERIFHTTPSGLDHLVAIHGGAVRYEKGEVTPQFTHLTYQAPLILALTWFPRQGSTSGAVSAVAARHAAQPDHYHHLFNMIGHLANTATTALTEGDLTTLGECLTHNHKLLIELGVSTPELNQTCEHFIVSGALGAKMSGAGHGGVCFGLFSDPEHAREALRTLKTPTWLVELPSNTHE